MFRHSCWFAFGLATILLGAGLALGPADAVSSTWTVVPFSVGDTSTYEGTVDFTIHIEDWENTVFTDGSQGPALPVLYEFDANPIKVFIDPNTARVTSYVVECMGVGPDGCVPWGARYWTASGNPGILGASILQGRSWKWGDSLEVAPCMSCSEDIRIEILPPDSISPTGTDFVAVVTAQYESESSNLIWPSGRLDMAHDIPFPLRATILDSTIELRRWTQGEVAAAMGNEPYIQPVTPLTAVPFEGAYPAEGTPLKPHPTLREAREATAREIEPNELTGYFYGFGEARTTVSGVPVVVSENRRFDVWSVGLNGRESLSLVSEQFQVGETLGIPRTWTATEGQTSPETAKCEDSSVRVWELVRHGTKTGIIHRFSGYAYLCRDRGALFDVLGAVVGSSPEVLTMDAQTGLLVQAREWMGDPNDLK